MTGFFVSPNLWSQKPPAHSLVWKGPSSKGSTHMAGTGLGSQGRRSGGGEYGHPGMSVCVCPLPCALTGAWRYLPVLALLSMGGKLSCPRFAPEAHRGSDAGMEMFSH